MAIRSESRRMEARIAQSVDSLTAALRAVLDELPGRPTRPLELTRLLNLNKSISSRVCRAVRVGDALTAAHLMPGPEALRMLLDAATRETATPATVDAARMAVDGFERLVREVGGDRAGLDAIISESVGVARTKFELGNKQAVFRGISNLRGVRAEVQLTTLLVHPAAESDSCDCVAVFGLLGLRRQRPSAEVQLSAEHLDPNSTRDVRLTLDGDEVDGMQGLLLRDFCSHPLPPIDVRREGRRVTYTVAADGFGPASAVDLILAELNPGRYRRWRADEAHQTTGGAAIIDQPVRTLVFDMLVHQDVWNVGRPEIRVYDTAIRGFAHPDDPGRNADRLDLAEDIEELGLGSQRWRIPDVPRYPEILRMICDKVGWATEQMRGYRCHIQYPLYGSQVCMVFQLAENAGDSHG